MNIATLGSLVIVGTAVSLLVQWLKQSFGGGAKTQAIVIGLSIAAGGLYFFFQTHTKAWENMLVVLAAADVAYNYVIAFFESKTA